MLKIVANDLYVDVDVDLVREIMAIIDWFSPSVHKSLIQKLIRTRCEGVEYGDVVYPVVEVIMASMVQLMLNPGVFVPNIRRFVTGIESLTKRLAVTIFEDSYIANTELLMELMAAGLLAQTDRESDHINKCI